MTNRLFNRRVLVIAAIVLLVSVLLAACGSDDDDSATQPTTTTTTATSTTPTTAEPTTTTAEPTTTTAAPTTTAPAPASTRLSVYFLRGDHLAAVHRSVPETKAVAAAAARELLEGPTKAERDAGLSTAIPAGTSLRGVSISNGVATVDLSSSYQTGGGSLSMMARAAQVVFTLTQFSSVQRVEFQLDGRPLTTLGGEGLILDAYDDRAAFEDLLPAILVESPAVGDRVTSPVRVWGTANVFEAVFRIELMDRTGRAVVNKVVMASSGTGTRGTFDFTFRFAAPSGSGRLVVSFESPKDGSKVVVEEIPVTLP